MKLDIEKKGSVSLFLKEVQQFKKSTEIFQLDGSWWHDSFFFHFTGPSIKMFNYF